jgi:tetratricopeptide (TPR) repeat protein
MLHSRLASALAVSAVAAALSVAAQAQDQFEPPLGEPDGAPAARPDSGLTDPRLPAVPDFEIPEGDLPGFDAPALGIPGLDLPALEGDGAITLGEDEEAAPEEPPMTRAERMDKLFVELAAAPDEEEARFIAEEIEALWRDSGSPTVDLLTDRATDALDIGDPTLARELINGALELGPEHAEAWAESARIALVDEELGVALEHIEKAVTLEPRHYYALTELGIILEALDSPMGAYEAYEKALELNPRLPDAVEGADRTRREAQGRAL